MPAFQTGAGAADHADVVFAAIAALNFFGFYRVFALRAVGGPTGFSPFGPPGGAPRCGNARLFARKKGRAHCDQDDQQGQPGVLQHHNGRQSGDQGQDYNDIEQDGPQKRLWSAAALMAFAGKDKALTK